MDIVGIIGPTAGGKFMGYTDDQATEKKLMRNVFIKGDCWFRTGDLVKLDSEGFYYFVDRIGDTYRWKGENVSTGEVESAFSGVEGIEEVTVYGVAVPGYEGRAGMASLVVNEKKFSLESLYKKLENDLPPFAQPQFLRIHPEIEITSTFKYKKADLVRLGFSPALVKEPIYFRDSQAKKFIPLDLALFDEIVQGRVRVN